jgi:RNA polymerase sigma factor (sigma-70 family)
MRTQKKSRSVSIGWPMSEEPGTTNLFSEDLLIRRRRGAIEVSPESPEDGVTSSSEAFVDQSPDPEESCWRRERTQLLTAAINRLGPRVRRTILLRDIEERSAEETAQILGTSIGAVKARVFQGRRKLRRTVNARLLWGVYAAGSRRGSAVDMCEAGRFARPWVE